MNHDLLIEMIWEVIRDETVIALIKKFLRSGVTADGLVSLKRLRERLKALTSRKRSGTIEWISLELTIPLTGWLGYYRIAGIKTHLERISEWLRRRIRQRYLKRWKRVRTRYENLIPLGVPREKAWQWANSLEGCWRIAGSGLLTATFTNHYFEARGFPNLVKRYEELRARDQRLQALHTTH